MDDPWAEDSTVIRIKRLYEEHDAAELELVEKTKLGTSPLWDDTLGRLWQYHDQLERNIVRLEAKLPLDVLLKLKAGEI